MPVAIAALKWRRSGVALLLALLAATAARAQDGPSSAGSGGPIGDGRPVGDESGPVGDTSVGGMLSGPTRDGSGTVGESSTGGMLSGPVGEASVGSATSDRPIYGGGSIGASSRGAVRQPANLPPLRMERPVSEAELRDLEQELRAIQPLEE